MNDDKGLGDTLARVSKAVGVKPCGGCGRRAERLNQLFPYRRQWWQPVRVGAMTMSFASEQAAEEFLTNENIPQNIQPIQAVLRMRKEQMR